MVRPAPHLETPSQTHDAPNARGPGDALDDLDALGEEIAEISAHINAVTRRLLKRVAAFDALFQECGGATGFRSTAHWLAWRTGLSAAAAREKVRVAKALVDLPGLGAAMGRGALSYSKIRALTRVATPANESELLELAEHATAAELERLVRGWKRVDLAHDTERARHDRRGLTLYAREDGSWQIRGRLDPEVGAALSKALEAASEALYGRRSRTGTGDATRTGEGAQTNDRTGSDELDPSRTDPSADATTTQRRADAVGLLAEAALRSDDLTPRTPRALSDAGGPTETNDTVEPGNTGHAAGGVSAETDHVSAETPDASMSPFESSSESVHISAVTAPASPSVRSRADRYQVVLHLEPALWDSASGGSARRSPHGRRGAKAPLVGTLGHRLHVSAETARRIACDAGLVPMARDERGRTLDVGRRTRTVPAALRRALEHRDRGCRFPGCMNRHCDAHHIVHWSEGGETRLDNLVLLCRRHHRAVHEGGFVVEWLDAKEVTETEGAGKAEGNGAPGVRFRRPDGKWIQRVPPAAHLAAPHPLASLRARHRRMDLGIDARSLRAGWLGEDAFDVSLVLDALRDP